MSEARFRTNVLLKSIIGKDLITNDNFAVLELVKNSFDAGSKNVHITFENILKHDDSDKLKEPTKKTSRIIIEDKGIGMSDSDIREKWLNIAYSEKKEKREEFGRVLAGNKGVGRFSCDRLGRFLTIYTRKIGNDYIKLFIDWRDFEKEGKINFNIQDITLKIDTLSEKEFVSKTGFTKFQAGTILDISYLRASWTESKIISLKRQLERLINPNQAFKRGKFGVKIIAKEFRDYDGNQEDYNKINGDVENKIFEKLDFKTSSIHAKIDEQGKYITTTLQDRGNEIFLLKERNKYNLLSNVDITIYYLNTYSKAYFAKQTGMRSYSFGSIYLFINGFRIPPYGDEGDDWLGMENRKGQGRTRYLGTREVVGRIEINDKNEIFKIISNRSGVVDNDAFDQLTKSRSPFGFYYKIFRRLERFVVEGIDWDSTPEEASDIEKKISDKKWHESKEIYNEDSITRNKRILTVINNIIDSKKDEIIELSINEEFIKQIIQEQTERAKSELESIIKLIGEKSKELNPEIISDVLNKISENSEEIKNFSNILSSYVDTPEKEIKGLNLIQNSLQKKNNELLARKEKLEEKLKEEEEARLKAEEARRKAEEAKQKEAEARRKAEEDLLIEKEKNTFLRATSRGPSEDVKGLMHNIKLTSKNIKSSINYLINKIKSDKFTKKDIYDIYEKLEAIKFNNEKVLKISKLITRANFKTNENSQVLDVVKYIEQYISIYDEIFDVNEMKIKCGTNNTSFVKRLSALDLSLIFDDLISNSEKADARKVLIEFFSASKNQLKVIFSDDGKGVINRFLEEPESMFELGVSGGTLDGSGIGLYSVRKALIPMQAEIKFMGNNKVLKGASFEIIFKK